jgi:TolA-binding protein
MRDWFRSHPGWTATIVAVVALLVGAGIGAAGTEDQARIAELEEQVADLENDVSEAERDAEDAEEELNDRLESIDAREDELRAAERDQAREARRRQRELSAREQEISAAEQELESSQIPDGIWQSGRDFEPGLYRAPGGEGCYWAKLGSANTDDIINNGGFSANQTLQIDSPFFETSDCGEWVKIE